MMFDEFNSVHNSQLTASPGYSVVTDKDEVLEEEWLGWGRLAEFR